MKIENMRISTRLYLALGVILALVAILAWETVTQTDALWLQTKTMYDHPLQVRRAVGAFKNEVTGMDRDMRGLMLAAGSDQELADLLAQIEAAKADGIGGAQARHLSEQMEKVEEFARNKADLLFRETTSLNNSLNQRSYLYAGTILFFLLLIAYLLVRWVRKPLQQLTATADHFRQGDLEARSGYAFANEFGVMATAFDAMADTIAAEIQLKDKARRLAAATARETEIRAFCRELLTALVDQTGSQIGAVYLLNPQQTAFEHFESIGLGAGGRATFSAEAREGEFGAALATGQVQHITAIPDDTAFTFATVSGEFRPREIITLPVLADHTTTAAASLQSPADASQSPAWGEYPIACAWIFCQFLYNLRGV